MKFIRKNGRVIPIRDGKSPGGAKRPPSNTKVLAKHMVSGAKDGAQFALGAFMASQYLPGMPRVASFKRGSLKSMALGAAAGLTVGSIMGAIKLAKGAKKSKK